MPPLKKKTVKGVPTFTFRDILDSYNALPLHYNGNDIDFFDSNITLLGFYKSAFIRGIRVNDVINRSVPVLINALNAPSLRKRAIDEIARRFDSLTKIDQQKLLFALFQSGNYASRRAVLLLSTNSLYDSKYDDFIIAEYLTDKGIPKSARTACENLLLDSVSSTSLIEHKESLVKSGLDYYILCARGLIREVDMSKMSPQEFLLYYLKSASVVEENTFLNHLSAAIKHYVEDEHYIKIKRKTSWRTSIISLKPVQTAIQLSVSTQHVQCVEWIYSLDRRIQSSITENAEWNAYAPNEFIEGNIEIAMTIFYSFVVSYLEKEGYLKEYYSYKINNEDRIDDDQLPF